MDARESLKFMAPAFGAKLHDEHETYLQFDLKLYSAARLFGEFLDLKEYNRSAVVGHKELNGNKTIWRITVWFYEV